MICLYAPVLLAAALAAAPAADETAEHFLKQVYGRYIGGRSKGISLDKPAEVKRWFAPELAALILKDRNETPEGDASDLEGDPFIDAQDWKIAKVDIAVQQQGDQAATGTVKFDNAGEAKTIVVDLTKSKGGCRIREITSNGQKLSALFTKK